MAFYLCLPSNASMNIYEHNTLQKYTVQLAEPIHLGGQYEVALCQMSFPNNFNVKYDHVVLTDEDTAKLISGDPKGVQVKLKCVKPGTYHGTLVDLANDINKEIKSSRVKIRSDLIPSAGREAVEPKLTFNTRYKHFQLEQLKSQMGNLYLILSNSLAEKFGFSPRDFNPTVFEATGKAQGVKDRPIRSLWVYTDIITPQFVGDVKAPLLRIVNAEGNDGEDTNAVFYRLHYYPLLGETIHNISIDIRTGTGDPLPFSSTGRVVVSLHLRPIKA